MAENMNKMLEDLAEVVTVLENFSRLAGLTGVFSLEDLIKFDDAINVIRHHTTIAQNVQDSRKLKALEQAVDVGAIREVIDELNIYCETSDDSCYGTLSTSLVRDYTGRLTRAIDNKGNGVA